MGTDAQCATLGSYRGGSQTIAIPSIPLKPAPHGFWEYLCALLGATRPHFFALPVGAAYAGAATTETHVEPARLVYIGLIAGGGWACGQLLNDVLDREADSIDAPNRPAVRGLLPLKSTILLAFSVGVLLLGLLAALTPLGLKLGLLSMMLILTYNICKGIPGLGNLSHGALIACAAYIGAAVARPHSDLAELNERTFDVAAVVFGWAALYLQGNYEKDARGDAHAGYRTLAHVLGDRQSALLRAAGAAGLGMLMWGLLPLSIHRVAAAVGVGLVLSSALWVARKNHPTFTLKAYRWTVHGAVIGMLALGGAALPFPFYLALSLAAIILTELAFRRTPNP